MHDNQLTISGGGVGGTEVCSLSLKVTLIGAWVVVLIVVVLGVVVVVVVVVVLCVVVVVVVVINNPNSASRLRWKSFWASTETWKNYKILQKWQIFIKELNEIKIDFTNQHMGSATANAAIQDTHKVAEGRFPDRHTVTLVVYP